MVIAGKTTAITGKRAPSNAPELGKNAITLLAQKISEEQLVKGNLLQYFDWLTASFHEKHYGEGVALDFKDQDSGQLILTPHALEKRGQQLVLSRSALSCFYYRKRSNHAANEGTISRK